jgi:hypothetical protein
MLGVIASGATPSGNQLADGLTAINGMLESWRTKKLYAYAEVNSSLTLVSSQQSYSVGVGGNLNITRPVQFEDAYITQSNVDSPVRLIDQMTWDSIPDKTVTSPIVQYAFYNPTMTGSLGTLLVYPTPNAANVLHLISWIVLDSLSAVGDTVLLPPGYDRAISSNLAIELAPEYRIDPSENLKAIARESKAAIKGMNITPVLAGSELSMIFRSRPIGSNILTGP